MKVSQFESTRSSRMLVDLVSAGTALSLLLLAACSSNPFGDDDISGSNQQIRGTVKLGSQLTREGVYVWLEGINAGARTDAAGRFTVTIPPGQSSVTGGFNLYSYLANYKLASMPVAVRNGSFLYSQGQVDDHGDLRQDIVMHPLFTLTTSLIPKVIVSDSTGLLNITFTLTPYVDSVSVYFPGVAKDWIFPIMFQEVNRKEVYIYSSVVSGLAQKDLIVIGPEPLKRSFAMSYWPKILPRGEYEVFAYLLVRREPVPPALIASLGNNVEEIGSEYAKIPFHRQGDHLQVQ